MKKIMRKGFTLVELLVVLAVIGILTSTAAISGREVSNIAQANKIVENFKVISAAMNMYYSDNTDACNAVNSGGENNGKLIMTAAKIKTALEAYLKSISMIADSAAMGKFSITVVEPSTTVPASWWLIYTLPDTSVKLAKILENKAEQEGFVTEASGSTAYVTGTVSNGKITNKTVCYQVR